MSAPCFTVPEGHSLYMASVPTDGPLEMSIAATLFVLNDNWVAAGFDVEDYAATLIARLCERALVSPDFSEFSAMRIDPACGKTI